MIDKSFINTPENLAIEMSRLTHLIKYAIKEDSYHVKRSLQELLLPNLDNHDFADLYAQTISYGLFIARLSHCQTPGDQPFNRRSVSTYIPAIDPFLRRLFNYFFQPDSTTKIDLAIDNLIKLLAQVNMSNILENFGLHICRFDPIMHFYETFLAAYNADLRKKCGVYYTPEPVVYFIVRSVDLILKNRFNLPLGLADNSKDEKTQKPRVQILDPATGTGVFLYGVVNQIYQNLENMGMADNWNQYVQENLLNRLFGFELLFTPYSIAHLNLGLQLQNLGYEFNDKQSLGIYLTNTLDEGLKKAEVLFSQCVTSLANEECKMNQNFPVLVVLGNPPYSGNSANKGEWIAELVKDYYYVDGLALKERNSKWLQDDYVKFIRFGQWRINQTGFGILAFITNHGYLDNPTFRGMRQSLMQSFTDIYIFDLHGNSKKKEVSPDALPDKNVFDIQQGVSIGIFIKEPGKSTPAKVNHAELWGSREYKYEKLNLLDIDTTEWSIIQPQSPFYLFSPQNQDLLAEYNEGKKLTEIFPVNSLGFQTHRDNFAIDFEYEKIKQRMEELRSKTISDEAIKQKYQLKDNRDWNLEKARKIIRQDQEWEKLLIKCLYRPFDWRYCYFSTVAMDYPRLVLQQNMIQDNLAILCSRQQANIGFQHIWCSDIVAESCVVSTTSREGNQVFPLYIYPDTENNQGNLLTERTPNLSQKFLNAIREKLGYIPAPEAIFYYIYAIFHSPTYRQRYAEFLKIDFPHVPLTSNDELFKNLAAKGEELVQLHLMKSPKLNKIITKYPVTGDNAVTEIKYQPNEQRIYINKQQYFEGVSPEVWDFKVGGYQVLDKWLKDRKKANRSLSFDDVLHYQRVIVGVKETMQMMTEIDEIMPVFPLE